VAPKGQSTRPTADRTRQAAFNILEHAPWSPGLQNQHVLDLFAGSGALGLEALSRGAAFCRFVETHPAARQAIDENITRLRLVERAVVSPWNATRLETAPTNERYGLAFLDPPYRERLIEPALARLIDGRWLTRDAIVIVECAADEVPPKPDGFEILDSRTWGAARIQFLRVNSSSPE
jgi:16S rRNA (guanine966-N2)-methyltransferase